jgi:hypothetical protein
MDNKLKEEIAEVLGERELWDFENTLNVEVRTDKLYSIIEDVVCEFTEWRDNDLLHDGSNKELFQYFIKNIYQNE